MRIYIVLSLFFISLSLFSGNLYIDSEISKNPVRLSISAGFNSVEIDDPDTYYDTMSYQLGHEGDETKNVYERFVNIQVAKRLFNSFYIGVETGIAYSYRDDEYSIDYNMYAIPMLVNVGYELGLFNVTIHGGIQSVRSNDIVLGAKQSYPVDLGARVSYAGFELKGSYLFSDEASVRKDLILSLGFSLLLM